MRELLKNLLIIIPTYNERDNINQLIPELKQAHPEVRLLVVDDNSPDGTAYVVRDLARQHEGVELLLREEKRGMASAYLDAFAKALADKSLTHIATMDADFSHDPKEIKLFFPHAEKYDLVVGSRYVSGGKIRDWAPWRKLISKYGNIYTKLVTKVPVKDLTAGYVLYSRKLLDKILPEVSEREFYAYQTEMKYLAHKSGARIKEVPITFRERISGKSKLKRKATIKALFFPWYLRLFK